MSMEAMLDEERLEVLALLEGTASRTKSTGARSPSPFGSTRSPVRSMLDFDEPSPSGQSSASGASRGHRPAPIRSMLDFDGPPKPLRSMLDTDSPPNTVIKPAYSATNSPLASPRAHVMSHAAHPRSFSDAASKPAEFGPRAMMSPQADPTAGYQFSGIITNHVGQAMPKRVTQGGKRGVMSEVMRGSDVQNLIIPGDGGRHYSVGSASASSNKSKTQSKSKSKSPGRLSMRSSSPGTHLLSGRHLSPAGRAVLGEATGMDMQNAYRRLSDANLARSGGSLAVLSHRKRSDDARLVKDYMSPDGEILNEESSDEDGGSTSDEEPNRGRRASRTPDTASLKSPIMEPKKRTSQSLLAAAEEERLEVAAAHPQYQYRSLLDDPEITVTNPSGERSKPAKPGIHPVTSFDYSSGTPGTRTPIDSDTEQDFTDIKRAQKLVISMTPILNAPDSNRAIRIIYRGEYAKVAQDAENEHRRLKKYIVASDMSEESTHALEWTVGTVLRDGDTMICLYCIDEETGIVSGDNAQAPEDPKATKEQAGAVNAVAHFRSSVVLGGIAGASSLLPLRSSDQMALPPPAAERTKAEDERERAINDITDRVTRLLRKTRLQVRVVVEVLHCKNPKHLITEVIDLVNPTLVVLGSRGRSALKGVILGSFSNYLVTKSSVPVMVARKRLRKQSKYKRTLVPQVNLLTNPAARSLANAKID